MRPAEFERYMVFYTGSDAVWAMLGDVTDESPEEAAQQALSRSDLPRGDYRLHVARWDDFSAHDARLSVSVDVSPPNAGPPISAIHAVTSMPGEPFIA